MRILFLTTTCLLLLFAGTVAARDYPWCSTMDNVFAEDENGNLVLRHERATYNCCPDSFTFTATISNDSLYVTEREVLTTPCDCMCCYNITHVVTGLAPGEWHVVYRWLDDEPWTWRDWHLSVIIGDPGLSGLAPVARSGHSGCLDPSGTPENIQSGASLRQNVPNPFNPQTTIAFELPKQAAVSLRVFDVSGRLVIVLMDGETIAEGRREVVWNGRDDTGRRVAAGAYFYRLEAGRYAETKRMVLMK